MFGLKIFIPVVLENTMILLDMELDKVEYSSFRLSYRAKKTWLNDYPVLLLLEDIPVKAINCLGINLIEYELIDSLLYLPKNLSNKVRIDILNNIQPDDFTVRYSYNKDDYYFG